MSVRSTTITGAQFSLLYGLCTAVSMTLISYFEIDMAPIALAFLTFLFTTICFNGICLPRYRNLWPLLQQQRKLLLLANIYSAVCWIATFIVLETLPPALGAALFFGTLPIATYFFQPGKIAKMELSLELLLAVGILVILVLLTSSQRDPLTLLTFLKVLLMIVAAIAAALYNLIARQLGVAKLPASAVMAHRSWLLLLVSGIYIVFSFSKHAPNFQWHNIGKAFIVSLISSILPLYFLQKALERISAVLVSYFITVVPILVYFVQLLVLKYTFQFWHFVLYCALAVLLALASYLNVKRARKTSAQR